ncbi:hypothetical protein, partial [uncultured Alcanivorax sp.]|uniref:hypothetical protein n=1 Tax=uncultured Alcanivorax sp. TaxID=191215 RepID=UPI002607762D
LEIFSTAWSLRLSAGNRDRPSIRFFKRKWSALRTLPSWLYSAFKDMKNSINHKTSQERRSYGLFSFVIHY